MMKLKKGDEVIVTMGKDKGKKGKIEKIYAQRETALIPGLNLYKRHLKKRDEKLRLYSSSRCPRRFFSGK